MNDLKAINDDLKEKFPEDKTKSRMAMAVAIKAENEGNKEKAEEYLDKAVASA